MMLTNLLTQLRELDVRLWLEDDRLRYNAPEGVMTPALRAELSQRKSEILVYLRAAQAATQSQPAAILKATRTKALPLSFAQERLWFLDQLDPGNAAYNLPSAVRLQGVLHVPALERSLNEIMRRHEVLRTTFALHNEQPIQVIAPALHQTLPCLDLAELLPADREARARQLIAEDAQQPFDLTRGSLLRVRLLRLDEQDHILLLTMHHITSDGWSLGVLIRELTALYHAFSAGQSSPLPELPIQYADYAAWQRQWLSGETLARQLAYWQQQFSGELPTIELPTDRPRPPVQTFHGATHTFTVPPELTAQLQAVSHEAGATLFMTLLAAFQTLLQRYTGQTDLVIGTPIANRTRLETEALIGFFVNTLALRVDLQGNPSFRELLARVREATLGAYAHQDLPFDRLVDELHAPRDLSRTPLFQVMFALQNAPMPTIELSALRLQPLEADSTTAKFDLSLFVIETADGLLGQFEYNTDLFVPATIQRMTAHLLTLLNSLVQQPDARISDLPILTAAEQQQLLIDWNDTSLVYPTERCLHELFEAQVAQTPDAVAIVLDETHLSYRELNDRANQLARHLQQWGVGPEVLVGLCVERTLEMLIGLLGILKAGGAYVPLDPAYPQERLAFILEDTHAPILLTQVALLERLPAHTARCFCLDRDWHILAKANTDNLPHTAFAQNLAYLIYTSGSTGRPKGVAMQHRQAVAFIHWTQQRFAPEHFNAVLAATSICFDLSIFELFATLSSGGAIVLAQNALHLPQLPAAARVTLVNTVPSAAQELLHSDGLPDSVRVINLAGEPLPQSLVEQLYQRSTLEAVFDLYGPSETTTYSTHALRQAGGRATIGRPIDNTQIYLLDAHFQPVPIGVPGEILIGGAGVARGYLQRPDLTAERFIPNPFGVESGTRLYRTGDLARYLPDGNLEFLGRLDHQVKVRGFRIELGEIETALRQYPAIQQAVAIAREVDVTGFDRQLVAYLVSQTDILDLSELRRFLQNKLPDYMIPAVFVTLESLPLTPNGKLDRRALPAPDTHRTPSARPYVPPRTPEEQELAQIWIEILHVPQVSVEDNFFELGGHSLLATRVISRIRQVWQIELPVRALFEAPTIAGLAARLQVTPHQVESQSISSITSQDRFYLSFAQERLWVLEQLAPETATYNIPSAVRLQGRLDRPALERSLNEIVRRHEILRTTFALHEEQPIQVITPAQQQTLPYTDLTDLPLTEREARARQLIAEDAQRPFDLTRGPLLRVKLLRLNEQDHILLLTMHHIISDGWSMGVLIRELTALYHAFSLGQSSPLPDLPIQYADYAAWQRHWLSGDTLAQQLAYWQQQFKGELPTLDLPTDRPRPPVQTFHGAVHTFTVPAELTAQLQVVSHEAGATLFMTLLAAFQTLLHRYTGQTDLVIGTPIANRIRLETEVLIGFFVNTLALRVDLSGKPSFRELLARVREVTLSAYAHQDLPFDHLVDELHIPRDLSRTPLFQVMFALQNAPMLAIDLPGLRLQPLEADSATAKFDLTLFMTEVPDGLLGQFEYNTDLFEAATIQRMATHLLMLLNSLAQQPMAPLSDLSLLTAAEKHQLLIEWNDTALAYPTERCLHDLFEAQVAQTPEAIAVVFEDEHVTYAELNRRANQLARYLQQRGVGPETLVGLCVERSVEMIVGLLGILKAGGAYVPLDPTYPQERLAFMLHDADVTVLVTQSNLKQNLPEQAAVTICLDQDWEVLAQESQENVVNGAEAENLVYVMYTSGSTGTPKGIGVTHFNVVRLVRNTNYADLVEQTFLQFAPISFDASTLEVWGALLNGGRLIVPPAGALSLEELGRMIETQDLTTLWLTAGLFHLMVDEQLDRLRHCQQVLAGGDSLSVPHVNKALQAFGGQCQLINGYGPTENTTFTCCYSLNDVGHVEHTVPIGRPIANTTTYILDRNLQPVPIEVPGELYTGGDGLARGYLNRPALTADKFIPNPFSREPGGRLYKTGDLARYLPDGNIEFLGRNDQQVKVRGFRIELGEIETVLNQHAAIQQAAVITRQVHGPGSDKQLVAYLVPQSTVPNISDLRRYLQEQLPDYMIPAVFVTLDALPLTPNGKLDRRALPALEQGVLHADEALIAPRDVLEQRLLHIWQDLLGVQSIGIRHNFFELGGHSLRAIQLMARINQEWGIQLPIATLFQSATVEHLATVLRQHRQLAVDSSLVIIQQGEAGQRPLFLVHPGGGHVLCYVDLVRALGPQQPCYGLQARGFDDEQEPHATIEAMAQHYIQLLQTIQPAGPYQLSGWSLGGVVAFEMAHQLAAQGQVVELLALIDSYAPNPEAGLDDELSLLAAFAFDLGATWQTMPFDPEHLQQLSPAERLAYLWEQARQAGVIPAEVDLDRMRRLYRVFQNNVSALRHYQPRPYTGPIVLFKASEQFDEQAAGPETTWQPFAHGHLAVQEIPGHHYTLLREPGVTVLVEHFKSLLAGVKSEAR